MKLLELLDQYADDRFKFSERSLREYRTSVRLFGVFLGRPARAEDLTKTNLVRFLKSRASKGSISTAKKHRQQMMALARWCAREGFIESAPADIPAIHTPKRRVRAWHPREVAAMLEAVSGLEIVDGWGSLEWRALILVAYDSAERIEALLDCPRGNFDAAGRTIYFPAEIRKGRLEDHTASLHPETVEAVSRMLAARQRRSPKLFGWRLSVTTLRRRFRRILEGAEINMTGRKMFHDFRRTNYSLTWAKLGREAAMGQTGHSQDLSAFYLDKDLVAEFGAAPRVADSIPRPAA